ncbi:MAG: hypothetical protein HY321_05375 [Armatimonadetes bacterium]|nr:hypothetical protein [Armatimonadota bacterium]
MWNSISLGVLCCGIAILGDPSAADTAIRLDFSPSPLEQLGESPETMAPAEQPWRAAAGEGVRLTVPRPYARPGERWIDLALALDPQGTELAQTRVRARLFDLGAGQPVEEVSAVPGRTTGTLGVDLRRLGLKEARLSVELLREGERLGAAEVFLSARPCETPLPPGQRIAVAVDVPEGPGPLAAWPVTFGVPFPAGALWDADGLRLVDKAGKEIPCQKEVIGRWAPEGSVKWVRFDALVDSEQGCFVEVAAPGAGSLPAAPVRVAEQDGKVVLETGAARCVLGRGASPVEEVWLGERRVARSAGARGLYLVDQNGRVASASADEESMEVEARGPVAACVRFEGYYRTAQGEPLARHITRVEGYAGQPFVKVTHTLVLTRSTNEVWFKEIGWELGAEPGAAPRAIFNVSREEPDRVVSQSLTEGVVSAYMFQEDGLRMGVRPAEPGSIPWRAVPRGANRCSASAVREDETATSLFTGEEIGDWAALAGGDTGLALSCREAARQHPKEFEVRGDRIVLRLFSNRNGQELDFRTETLMTKWGLKELDPGWIAPERLEAVFQLPSDAIGWSKTHEILLAPLATEGLERATARLSELDRKRVYAHVDPWWIYRTDVLGPVYPRDPERFPAAEKVIEALFRNRQQEVPGEVYRGFMDYHAGPHFSQHRDRWRLTYTFLPDSWLLYARSGDRTVRDLAQSSNRVFMDNCVAHWTGGTKKKGIFVSAGAGIVHPGTGAGAFPLYWEARWDFNLQTSSNLTQSMLDYYLTGYRRAGDIVLEMAEALAREWRPGPEGPGRSRVMLTVRGLVQAYSFTWDPRLRALAEATIARNVYDPEGEVRLAKNRAYRSTTYKTRTDQDAAVDAWNILGDWRSYDIAMELGRHHWNSSGVDGRSTGLTANFLYRETKDPGVAAGLDQFVRESCSRYDPETGRVREFINHAWSELARFFQGLPAAMDVMARSDADRKWLASWLDFSHDEREPASVFVWKDDEERVDLMVRGSYIMGEGAMDVRVNVGGTARLVAHTAAKAEWAGKDLHRVCEVSAGVSRIRIPKDAPEGLYEVVFQDRLEILPENPRFRLAEQRDTIAVGKGAKTILAGSRVRLVVRGSASWEPAPLQPSPRIYFSLPEGSAGAEITFAGSARLFTPGGEPFEDGKPLTGPVNLPADQPGLWSFTVVTAGVVRGRGFPPYFAVGDPAFYFNPEALMAARGNPPSG